MGVGERSEIFEEGGVVWEVGNIDNDSVLRIPYCINDYIIPYCMNVACLTKYSILTTLKMDTALIEFLTTFRYMIWLAGGFAVCWLMMNLPGWSRVARYGSWVAQRDYAAWRVKNAVMALVLLLPLLIVTTVVSFV